MNTAKSERAQQRQRTIALPDSTAAEMADSAAGFRRTAGIVTDRKLAARLRRRAASLERKFKLWCSHHGREPQRASQLILARRRGRGGRRAGAGRRAVGNVAVLVRLKPATAQRLRQLSAAAGQTLGEWLDANLG